MQYHAITNNKGVTGEQGALKGALHNANEGEGKLLSNFDLDMRPFPVVGRRAAVPQ